MQAKKSVFRPIALAVSALISTGAFAQNIFVGATTTPSGTGSIRIESAASVGSTAGAPAPAYESTLSDESLRFENRLIQTSTQVSGNGIFTNALSGGAGALEISGIVDFTQANVTGLRGLFNPAEVTTTLIGGTMGGTQSTPSFDRSGFRVDLVNGEAALGATTTTTLRTTGLATLDSVAVTGATTLNGATTVNNRLNVNGETTIVGATSINRTGSESTLIGNRDGQVHVEGSAVTVMGQGSGLTLREDQASLQGRNGVRVSTLNSNLTLENSQASLTVQNAQGNTHGLVVGESSTTLSGGTSSTNLTLNDNGATFSNAATGAPTRVTGVANGSGDFDAVNVRQFSAAVAGVAASANIPGLDTNKAVSVGVGMGSYMNSQALAFGGSYRFSDKGVLRATLATGLNSGGGKTSFGIGAGWSW